MEQLVKAIINAHHEVALDATQPLDIIQQSEHEFHVVQDQASMRVEVVDVNRLTKEVRLLIDEVPYTVQLKDQVDVQVEQMGLTMTGSSAASDAMAPMPGLVVSVSVAAGDQVSPGDPLLILEAMKMENVIKAETEATIQSVEVAAGDKVEKGQLLIEFTKE